MEHTENTFRIHALGAFKLYDVYISTKDQDIYFKRVKHLVADWGSAVDALHKGIMATDQVPTPEDLARLSNSRHAKQPEERRPVRKVYDEDPRERIVEALAANEFRDVYTGLAKLKPSGNNEMKANCPFKKHRNSPSFNYNTTTGLWICRSGCGGGTAFDYEMAVTGESYRDLLHRWAWDLGIELDKPSDAKEKMSFMEDE